MIASVLLPIVAGLIAYFIQRHRAVTMGANIAVSVASAILAYAFLVSVEFISHFVRTPGEIHSVQAKRISELEREPVTVEIQSLIFGLRMNTWVAIVRLKIFADASTTLHDWTLCSEDERDLKSPHVGFPGVGAYSSYLRLEQSAVCSGFLEFSGYADPDKQWFLCITDHKNIVRKYEIAKTLYSVTHRR